MPLSLHILVTSHAATDRHKQTNNYDFCSGLLRKAANETHLWTDWFSVIKWHFSWWEEQISINCISIGDKTPTAHPNRKGIVSRLTSTLQRLCLSSSPLKPLSVLTSNFLICCNTFPINLSDVWSVS